MAKGVVAFVIMVALTMSISVLAGLGYYAELRVDYSSDMNEDTKAAAEAFIGQTATDRAGGSVLQDFTTSGATTLSSAWQVLANTSGVLQLLFGLPPVLADLFQLFFRLMFGITFAGFIRGVVVD